MQSKSKKGGKIEKGQYKEGERENQNSKVVVDICKHSSMLI